MRLRTKFAIAVLGIAIAGTLGVRKWAEVSDTPHVLAEAAGQIWEDAQYRRAINNNMTPERHELYLQMQRSTGVAPDGATTCFTIPAAANDADAKALTNIIRAQDKIMGGTQSVISRGTPAAACKFKPAG